MKKTIMQLAIFILKLIITPAWAIVVLIFRVAFVVSLRFDGIDPNSDYGQRMIKRAFPPYIPWEFEN